MHTCRSSVAAVALLGALQGACATARPTRSPKEDPPPQQAQEDGTRVDLCRGSQPIPADIESNIRDSEETGRELFRLDQVGWIATDVFREHADFGEKQVGGWLALRAGREDGTPAGGYIAEFFSRAEPYHLIATVTVPAERGVKPGFQLHEPPTPLPASAIPIVRARQNAIRYVREQGGLAGTVNPVVIPAARGKGVLVYLLAGTDKREVVFGRHHLVRMSEDGTQVVHHEPLSRTHLRIPLPETVGPDPCSSMMIVNHVVSDWPLETHVFLSLEHAPLLILVMTERGLWRVERGKIAFVTAEIPEELRPPEPGK